MSAEARNAIEDQAIIQAAAALALGTDRELEEILPRLREEMERIRKP
jgi:hypothetical protein